MNSSLEAAERKSQDVWRERAGSGSLEPLERQQSAIALLGRKAVATPELRMLLQDASALLAETLEVDCGGVAELVDEGLQCSLVSTNSPEGDTAIHSHAYGSAPSESLVGYAVSIAAPVLVEDLEDERLFSDKFLRSQGIRSAIAYPLTFQDRSFGGLLVGSTQPGRFAPTDLLFVETIAHLVTTTMAREQAEVALEEEQQFNQSLLCGVTSLVVVLDPQRRITRVNEAVERAIGCDGDVLASRSLSQLWATPADDRLATALLDKLSADVNTVSFTAAIAAPAGENASRSEPCSVAWSFSQTFDRQGQPHTIIGTGRDLSIEASASGATLPAALPTAPSPTPATQTIAQPAADEAELKPFQILPDDLVGERRNKPRRAYPYIQLIAPMVGNRLPAKNSFHEVRCRDIAAGGFSFVAIEQPTTSSLVVAFGAEGMLTYLVARIVHTSQIQRGGQKMYLIGCRYTGRAVY